MRPEASPRLGRKAEGRRVSARHAPRAAQGPARPPAARSTLTGGGRPGPGPPRRFPQRRVSEALRAARGVGGRPPGGCRRAFGGAAGGGSSETAKVSAAPGITSRNSVASLVPYLSSRSVGSSETANVSHRQRFHGVSESVISFIGNLNLKLNGRPAGIRNFFIASRQRVGRRAAAARSAGAPVGAVRAVVFDAKEPTN